MKRNPRDFSCTLVVTDPDFNRQLPPIQLHFRGPGCEISLGFSDHASARIVTLAIRALFARAEPLPPKEFAWMTMIFLDQIDFATWTPPE